MKYLKHPQSVIADKDFKQAYKMRGEGHSDSHIRRALGIMSMATGTFSNYLDMGETHYPRHFRLKNSASSARRKFNNPSDKPRNIRLKRFKELVKDDI